MYSLYTMLFFFIAIGTISALVAKQKNRNPIVWFLIGFSFSLIGLLCLLLLPTKPKSGKSSEIRASIASAESHGEAAPLPSEERDFTPETRLERISLSPNLDWYYIDPELTTKGPFKIKSLRKEIIQNHLTEDTYIWCEECDDWKQILGFQNKSTLFDRDLMEEDPPKSS